MFLEHETLPETMPYEIGNPIRFSSEDVAKIERGQAPND